MKLTNTKMNIGNESIKNLEQAKGYFIAMGCSHFQLSRENFERSDEYYALNISRELESEWRNEEFEKRLSKIASLEPKELGKFYIFQLYSIIERNEYYLETMLKVTNDIKKIIPPEEIIYLLIPIIGTNGTQSHGGLIEDSFVLKRQDLAKQFAALAKFFIESAKNNNINNFCFLRGYFAEVIEYYDLKESNDYLNQLREEDYKEAFKYHTEGAKEDNIAAMIALAEHYISGKGCEINYKEAEYWLSKSAKKGDKSANEKFNELQNKLKKRNNKAF